MRAFPLSLSFLCLFVFASIAAAAPAEFVAVPADGNAPLPRIVVQHDPAAKTGFDWNAAPPRPWRYDFSDPWLVHETAMYLREAVKRMTGREPEVVVGNDLGEGIILTTLAGAPPEVKNDPAVQRALKNDGKDAYNHEEAFFIRSEPKRVLIVANTAAGLAAAAAELLESVGYEVLGMGPNWTHVPRLRKGLIFNLERAGRPSYYLRQLVATSGQSYGVGTIYKPDPPLSHEGDEPVDASYVRWLLGTRMAGHSMPGFPGHAMQAYHRAVVEHIKKSGQTPGFLAPTTLGAESSRPAASKDNAGALYITSDTAGPNGEPKVFYSTGEAWEEGSLASLPANIDLSVPAVRQIVFERLKADSEDGFKKHPDDVYVFGTDPEDGGGYATLAKLLHDKQWYPNYLKAEGIELGKPYVLHGFKGLDQPRELWDPAAPSDTVFGFNNWLLREYDKWIDSLPADQRVTPTGKSKKELIRASLYSYNYHDVPPNFNLDPRVRVMIASYPKHRGMGKWKRYATQLDLAQAYQVMLPREPSGDYRIISLAYYWDASLEGIPAGWSASAKSIAEDLRETHDAGIKALTCETDFNFGKFGLGYYLMSKMLWNADLTAEQLDAIRDRWFERAYGPAAKEAEAYYDFMLTENFTVNGPNTWGQAVSLLDAADKKLAAAASEDPHGDFRRRLDDLKQFWLYYYFIDTGTNKADNPDFRAFMWKGQMSYANAMHAPVRAIFGEQHLSGLAKKLPAEVTGGPAHYTHEETQAWWKKIVAHWPVIEVSRFADATLANGRAAREVDLNDLVMPDALRAAGETIPGGGAFQPFVYNAGYMKPANFLTAASAEGEEIGFKLWWPAISETDRYYVARDMPYGVERWNPQARKWDPVIDKTMTVQPSVRTEAGAEKTAVHLVEVRVKTPAAGTYRFDIGYGGNLGQIAGLDYDLASGKRQTAPAPGSPIGKGLTFFGNLQGLTQSPAYIYIPKGTKSVDLEVYDGMNAKTLVLYKGLPRVGANVTTRDVDISKRGTHRVKLEPGEDGTIAAIKGNGFAFPFLYSVPQYWAKSPGELLVPRAIAEADGLVGK